jgi:RimJ/RimL family protein N-acetyltransferase
MPQRPTLRTERLILRPFALEDAPAVKLYASAVEIAGVTQHIPHPYEDGMAEGWIASHQSAFEAGEMSCFAITLREGGEFIGAIGLGFNSSNRSAELGYWIGLPFWGQGYCTEAAGAVLDYGFGVRGLDRIVATHFGRNPASGRVMQKIGMTQEGCLRRHVLKWGRREDLVYYGILREEWDREK